MGFLITQTGGGSLTYKDAVRTASSANVPLTGSAPIIVGGVSLNDKDRVLLKNQGTASQNGIYTIAISGGTYTLTRSTDCNTSKEMVPNMLVPVSEGTSADQYFQLTTNAPIVLGTTALVFDYAAVYDHGLLIGLGDDDHTQYLNTTRAKTWFDTDYLKQTVTNGSTATVPSEDAVFDHVASATSNLANRSLSNLTSPTALNQDLVFNKASAAILQGSDAQAAQASHNLSIRAGNSNSAVNGGDLFLQSGTSSTGNGGSIYLRNTGTTTSLRGIFFRYIGASDQLVLDNNGGSGGCELRSAVDFGFTSDNSKNIGSFSQLQRPRYVMAATGFIGGSSVTPVTVSGWEQLDNNGTAAGSITLKGGDAVNENSNRGNNPGGNLLARGGDHPGATGTSGTQAAGSVTIRGGNKTAGTGNGGNVTISGGTSVGGTAGSIIVNTAGVERLRVTPDGNFKISSGLNITSRHAQTGTVTGLVSDIYIGCDSSGGAVTVNLPTASSSGAGKKLIIKDEGGNATTNNISIVGNGSDVIDGSGTQSLVVNYESVTLVCDGVSKWFII